MAGIGDYEGVGNFEMKAKNYNNSPMDKNYGSAESRFPSSSAVSFSSSLGGVGESPAKGWFKNLTKKLNPINQIKKIANMGKKAFGIGGGDKAAAQPHGDEMHTDSGGATAAGGVGEVPATAEAGVTPGITPDKTNQAAAAMAAGGAATAAGGQSAGGNKWEMLKASGTGLSAEEEVV